MENALSEQIAAGKVLPLSMKGTEEINVARSDRLNYFVFIRFNFIGRTVGEEAGDVEGCLFLHIISLRNDNDQRER